VCPCGSGEKYKRCCSREGRRWYEDREGRAIPEGLADTSAGAKVRTAIIEHLVEEGKLAILTELVPWEELTLGSCMGQLSARGRMSVLHEMGLPPELLRFAEHTGHLPHMGVWQHWERNGEWPVHPATEDSYKDMVRDGVSVVRTAYPYIPPDLTFVEAVAIARHRKDGSIEALEPIEVYNENHPLVGLFDETETA
jgi:hypothetical protein